MNFSFTKEEINTAAKTLWTYGKQHRVWAFHAPMGAGKTTLIHALCTGVLGITDAVSSPTFAIINEYESAVAGTVYHMDWYRLKGEEEARQAGVEDALLSGNLCFVEWPEVASALLPDTVFHVQLRLVDEQTRAVSIDERR